MTETALLPSTHPAFRTLRDELKYATRTEHEQLEAALDLMRADFTLANYRELLARYLGFYQSFEAYVQSRADLGWPVASFYVGRQAKQRWLQNDLEVLVDDPPRPAYLIPADVFSSLFATPSILLGAVYVIEGSMLGGRILTRHFSETLGLTPESGLQFFNGYGADTKMHWQALLKLLEESEFDLACRPEAVSGAKRMFALLHRHLLPSDMT